MRLSYELSIESPMVLAEELAKPFESCSLKAYWDVAGFPTNGWGNLLSRTTKQAVKSKYGFSNAEADEWLRLTYPDITQDEADAKLHENLLSVYKSVSRLVRVKISVYQYAALMDFAFNLGLGNLQISTLLRMTNREEFIEAADQFLRWNKAGGVVYKGLTRRRQAERTLFLRGLI